MLSELTNPYCLLQTTLNLSCFPPLLKMLSAAPCTSPRQLSPPKGNTRQELLLQDTITPAHERVTPFLPGGAHPTANNGNVCPGRASPATLTGECQHLQPQQELPKSSQRLKSFWRHKTDVRRRGSCQEEAGFLLSRFKWDFLRNPYVNPREDPRQSLVFSRAPVSKQTHNFS